MQCITDAYEGALDMCLDARQHIFSLDRRVCDTVNEYRVPRRRR